MIIYIFQCYSLKSSHPCILPQSSKDCSIHLCLVCYLAYRVIIAIFLSIYMRQYTVLVFFFLAYFTMYNRLQFHPTHQNLIFKNVDILAWKQTNHLEDIFHFSFPSALVQNAKIIKNLKYHGGELNLREDSRQVTQISCPR